MSNPNLPKFTPEQSLQYRATALAVRHAQKAALESFVNGSISLDKLTELAGGIKVKRVLTALSGQIRYFGPAKLEKLAKAHGVDFQDRRLSGVGEKQAVRLKELTSLLLTAAGNNADQPF